MKLLHLLIHRRWKFYRGKLLCYLLIMFENFIKMFMVIDSQDFIMPLILLLSHFHCFYVFTKHVLNIAAVVLESITLVMLLLYFRVYYIDSCTWFMLITSP